MATEIMQLDEKSNALVESGYFPDIKSIAQAKVKIWIGKSLGLNEYQSLIGIYISSTGKIGIAATIMASLIKQSQKYDYHIEKLDEKECVIDFLKIVQEKTILLGKSIFNEKDAAKCGLINKETYKSYPRNMLFARALSNGARWYCPETICGYYFIEELEDSKPEKTVVKMTSEGVNINGETDISEQIPVSDDSIGNIGQPGTDGVVQEDAVSGDIGKIE